ncbi:hypothetical protein WDA38_20680, partial [Acinetobacter pittii]|uniref:hypothetical protein n=1 Tax=Acinetobacter pittii TaxID=48296 RepID=UPI00374E5942
MTAVWEVSPTTTDLEAWRAQVEAKRERSIYFRQLEKAAKDSQSPQALAKAARLVKPKRTRKPAKPRKPRAPQLRPCAACGYLTRPNGTKAEDFPDVVTLVRGNADMCKTCHRHGPRQGPPRQEMVIKDCEDCGRKTRPNRRKASEFPFPTVARHDSKVCASCYARLDDPPLT